MKFSLTFFALMGLPAMAGAVELNDIAAALRAQGCYADSCTFEVLLPQFSDPVVYDIKLESAPLTPGDTLAECKYIISWDLHSPSGISQGFAAYFDGTHFRFRDERLQEYHAEQNPEPFAPAGDVERGVQNQAQFADLLPPYIAARLEQMAVDTSYTYTLRERPRGIEVNGKRRISGYEASEFTYTFDRTTLMPIGIELENNPGQLSEQSITVRYAGADSAPADCTIDLATLTERKSEAFEKYRENSFSLEKLPGRMLPEMSAPTLGGDRYHHVRGEAMTCPTVIAFVDTSVGSTPDVIAAVRRAVDYLPMQTEVVWAFVDRRADDVAAAIPDARPGETVLINARSAARACGVGALTPVLIFVAPDGRVSEILNGYNQNLESIVIQNISISN